VTVVSGVQETEQEQASPLTREWGGSLHIGRVVRTWWWDGKDAETGVTAEVSGKVRRAVLGSRFRETSDLPRPVDLTSVASEQGYMRSASG